MGRKRAIICFETEERFESVTDAANAIGAAWPLVSSALKRHGACRGFHFYYADEVKPDDSVFDRKVYKNSRPIICLETNERFESQALLPSKRGIRVRCVETGVVYKTITQAAKETGASQAGIRGAASGMAGGYRWEYVDD